MATEAVDYRHTRVQEQMDNAVKEKAHVGGTQQDQCSIYQRRRQVYLSERYAFSSNHSLITVADPDFLLQEG